MAFVGGDILGFSIDGQNFAVPEGTTVTIKLAGYENEKTPTGDGRSITKQKRKLWMVSGLQAALDNGQRTLETLQGFASSPGEFPVVISLVDGTRYQGAGNIVDELQGNTEDAATEAFTICGGGELSQQ